MATAEEKSRNQDSIIRDGRVHTKCKLTTTSDPRSLTIPQHLINMEFSYSIRIEAAGLS